MERDWKRFPIDHAAAAHRPAGDTLVNVPTRFFTATPAAQVLPARVILGMKVVVTARATSWTWRFGDDTSLATSSPGAPDSDAVTHAYLAAGSVRPRVDVTYTATYTIGDVPTALPAEGTTTIPGAATAPLRVREARSELDAA